MLFKGHNTRVFQAGERENVYRRVLTLYPLLFLALSFVVNLRLDFQQVHNDFWDVYFIARNLSWHDPQTWFNPQYPIGYSVFLRSITHGMPVVPAIVTNMFFGFCILSVCAHFFRKMLSPGYALLSLVTLSFFPQLFHYLNQGGGDPGALAFFTVGAVLIFLTLYYFPNPSKGLRFFAAGLLLGLGALFRYHVLVADGMFVVAVFAVYPRRWKSLALVSIGVCVAYSPQWIINIATGHGLLKTQFGPMNVYDLMYGLNWYHITGLHLPSVPKIIAQDPALFLRKYLIAFWSYKQAYLPPLFAAIFEKNSRQKNIARAIAVWVFIYFLLLSATTSGRQILLVLPLTFLTVGMSFRIIGDRLALNPRMRTSVVAIVGICMMVVYAHRDELMVKRRALERDIGESVEAYLIQGGCAKSHQVFSNDFDLYFRTLPYYIPYFNGAAPRLGTYLYNEAFPEFPVESGESFVAVCRNRNVRYVVLDADCRNLSDTLGALYDRSTEINGLSFETDFHGHKIYKVN